MKRHKSARIPGFHYSGSNIYFVTVCTVDRKRILENKIKLAIEKQIKELSDRFNIEIDTHVVMPNHIHALIWIKDINQTLPAIIGAFKSLTTREVWKLGHEGRLWQKGYYEHVVRNEKALDKLREYIINNPSQEKFDLEALYEESGTSPDATEGIW